MRTNINKTYTCRVSSRGGPGGFDPPQDLCVCVCVGGGFIGG